MLWVHIHVDAGSEWIGVSVLRFRHGAHIRLSGGEGRCTWRGYTYTTRAIAYVFMLASHVREYQSQLWNNFSSLRTLQRSLIQTATLYNIDHGAIFIPYIHNSRRRHRRKNRAFHSFQNTSISQQRTSQMIRCSPTAFDRQIYGFAVT